MKTNENLFDFLDSSVSVASGKRGNVYKSDLYERYSAFTLELKRKLRKQIRKQTEAYLLAFKTANVKKDEAKLSEIFSKFEKFASLIFEDKYVICDGNSDKMKLEEANKFVEALKVWEQKQKGAKKISESPTPKEVTKI